MVDHHAPGVVRWMADVPSVPMMEDEARVDRWANYEQTSMQTPPMSASTDSTSSAASCQIDGGPRRYLGAG